MLIKSRKLSVISLLMFVAVIAWPITGLSCGAGTKQYIIGGTPTCVSIVSNGVDAEITLVPTQSNPNPTWASTGITNFALTVNPTSPLACGGTHDDDCDDIKEAEHEEKSSSNVSNTATVAPAAAAPVLPPSGLVACSLPTPGYEDDFQLVEVPGTTVISAFNGSNQPPESGNLWVVTSTALSDSMSYGILKTICDAAVPSYTTETVSSPSLPTDFVPCNLKSKVSGTIFPAPTKPVKPTTLTCYLPANQCSGSPTEKPLVINDQGLIGVQKVGSNSHLVTDGDGSPMIEALPYSCQ